MVAEKVAVAPGKPDTVHNNAGTYVVAWEDSVEIEGRDPDWATLANSCGARNRTKHESAETKKYGKGVTANRLL